MRGRLAEDAGRQPVRTEMDEGPSMTNHETNGAGGPGEHAASIATEVGAPPVAQESVTSSAQPADAPGALETDVDAAGGPRISRARARIVTASPASGFDAPEGAIAPRGAITVVDRADGTGRLVTAERVEITQGGAEKVEAASVVVDRGGIGAVNANAVEVHRGGIGRLTAKDVTVTQGGVGAARADHLTIDMGGIGAAIVGRLELTRSAARSILAREAHLEGSFAQTVVANHVSLERGSNAIIVLARRVDGDVRALLDWRGALAFGAALGLVLGIVRRTPTSRRRA
jgi:hypothetical protein